MDSTTKPIRLYIAGPMTGYDQLNYPAFMKAAADLRAAGYDVVNPAEINAVHPQCWETCMRADIQQLMTCDGIAYLNGHEKSKGASIEVKLGHDLNMVVNSLNTWLLAAAESDRVVKNRTVIEASKIPTPNVDLGDLLKPNYNVKRPPLRTDIEGR